MVVLQNIALGFSDLLLTLLALLLLARTLLFSLSGDSTHPLMQLILRATNPFLKLPYIVLPPTRRIDFACWLTAYIVCMVELYLRIVLTGGEFHPALFLFSLIQLIELVLYIFVFALLALAIASWFMSPYQIATNALLSLFHLLTMPALNIVRRFLPPFGTVDLSPLVLLLFIFLIFIILGSL